MSLLRRMNRAAVLLNFNESLVIKELEREKPREGEVEVKLLIRPVNPADSSCCKGVYPGFKPTSFPAVPGLEGYGVIETVGNGVKNFKVGQRVAPILHLPRSFQEFVIVKTEDLVEIPDDISDEAAAQIVVNPFTVWGLFEKANIQKGQFIVQSGASSEVGRMLIIAAKMRGAKTINLVRRDDVIKELIEIGGDYVINTETEENLTQKIMEITNGKGADAAFDCVTGPLTSKIQAGMKDEGIILIYGRLDRNPTITNGLDFLFRYVKIDGFWLFKELARITNEDKTRMIQEVYTWMRKDHFAKHVGEKFSLLQINEAFEASLKPAKPGKVLVYNTI